ncbi:MAG: hypothetical protein ACYC7F_13720, partial [Gemmatimonadaceae bacterium]
PRGCPPPPAPPPPRAEIVAMALAIGPCMFVAPLAAVALIIAIPLWPVALALLSALLVVTWPVEQLCRLLRIPAFRGASATVWRWLAWMAKPLNWFDLPSRRVRDGQPTDPGAPPTGN